MIMHPMVGYNKILKSYYYHTDKEGISLNKSLAGIGTIWLSDFLHFFQKTTTITSIKTISPTTPPIRPILTPPYVLPSEATASYMPI
jgi:hypothetical protein